jgi:hypothetical protein
MVKRLPLSSFPAPSIERLSSTGKVQDKPQLQSAIEIDRARVREYLHTWKLKHSRAFLNFNPSFFSGFGREKHFMILHGRLLAQLDPEGVEQEASKIASDQSLTVEERSWGIRLLGVLAQAGHRESFDLLKKLIVDPNHGLREVAVYSISESDPFVKERPLYFGECSEGNISAFDAVSSIRDPATVSLMDTLKDQKSHRLYGRLVLMANDVLAKQEILALADPESRLVQILGNPASEDLSEWALRASGPKPSHRIMETLRKRLDLSLENGKRRFEKDSQLSRREGLDVEPRTFEELYVAHTNSTTIPDPIYDQCLLAYWQAGGKVTELETQRLRQFGYGCDPGQRLSELLAERPH